MTWGSTCGPAAETEGVSADSRFRQDPAEILRTYDFISVWKTAKFNYTEDAPFLSAHTRIAQLKLMKSGYSLEETGRYFLNDEAFAKGLYAALTEEYLREAGNDTPGRAEKEASGKPSALSWLKFLGRLNQAETWQSLIDSGTKNLEDPDSGKEMWGSSARESEQDSVLLEGLIPSEGGDRIFGIEAVRSAALDLLAGEAKGEPDPGLFLFVRDVIASEYEALQDMYEKEEPEYVFLQGELEKLRRMTSGSLLQAGTYEAPRKETGLRIYFAETTESE